MKKLIGSAVLIFVTAVTAASGAARLPRALSCAGKPLLRPSGVVVLSCADANSKLEATHWRSWNSRSATGTTTFGLNLCTPSCVASKMRYFRKSRVRLSAPRQTKRGPLFTRATITYVLHGKTKTFVAFLPTRPM